MQPTIEVHLLDAKVELQVKNVNHKIKQNKSTVSTLYICVVPSSKPCLSVSVTTSKVPPLLWPTSLNRRTYRVRKARKNQTHIKAEIRRYQQKQIFLPYHIRYQQPSKKSSSRRKMLLLVYLLQLCQYHLPDHW